METVNQEATQNGNGNEPGKTFTQDELNAIVNDRLKREKEKYSDYASLKEKAAAFDKLEEANKTELQKANDKATALETELNSLKKANEIKEIREKVAKETGVPSSLLTADTEEECKEQANAIMEFKKPSSYPNVKDGGEVNNNNGVSTRDQFAEWANQVFA